MNNLMYINCHVQFCGTTGTHRSPPPAPARLPTFSIHVSELRIMILVCTIPSPSLWQQSLFIENQLHEGIPKLRVIIQRKMLDVFRRYYIFKKIILLTAHVFIKLPYVRMSKAQSPALVYKTKNHFY